MQIMIRPKMIGQMKASWLGAAAASVLWVGSAAAQQASDPGAWCKKFLDTLMNRGPDQAAALINEETALGNRVKTVAPVLRDSATKANQSYGTIMNYERAQESKMGSRAVRLVYVVNHRNGATLYRMFFYRSERGWDLHGLQMEADMLKFDFD